MENPCYYPDPVHDKMVHPNKFFFRTLDFHRYDLHGGEKGQRKHYVRYGRDVFESDLGVYQKLLWVGVAKNDP